MIPSDLRLKPEEKKILSNLNNTIKKFHKMIYNPTLNENIFENSDLEFENDERSKGETKTLDGNPNNSKSSIFKLSLLNDLLENDKK